MTTRSPPPRSLDQLFRARLKSSIFDTLTIAFFAQKVGEQGRVVGIDHIQELINWSVENAAKNHANLMDSGRIKFVGKSRFRSSLTTSSCYYN